MQEIKFYSGENIPLELHKVRIVQKLNLVPIERRLEALNEGGYNTFRLSTTDVFLDMLTDSGTNAMSDNQLAAMMQGDDAYAGSQSFYRLEKAVQDVLDGGGQLVEALRAGIGVVGDHHGGKLIVAHGVGSAVGEHVEEKIAAA